MPVQRDAVVVRIASADRRAGGFEMSANRDEQLRDLMPPDDRAEARDGPKNRNPLDEEILLAGIIVEEADRQNADVAILEKLTHQ